METPKLGKKILIIDDSKTILKVYQLKLEAKGFDVEVAENGEEGMKIAQAANPDLILLDMIMPKMDGFAFLEAAQADKTLKKIPIIVFSTLSQQDDIERVMSLGATKYLPKDEYSVNEIVDVIFSLLQ